MRRQACRSHRLLPVALCLLCFASCHSGSFTARPVSDPPNLLLVTIDTFRADRLGKGIAPHLDRLAGSSWNFTNARSVVPLTLPSHTTVLTGPLPPAHGVRENGVDALSDQHPTVARLLREKGYRTAAFVGAYVLDRRFGLANGFDTYDDRIPRDPNATERLEAERPASAVVDAALAWLEHQAPEHPAPEHPARGTQHPAPEHPAPEHPAPEHPARRTHRPAPSTQHPFSARSTSTIPTRRIGHRRVSPAMTVKSRTRTRSSRASSIGSVSKTRSTTPSSSSRAITERALAITASRRTACCSTTRHCACR